LNQLTSAGGVYIVCRANSEPAFLDANPSGRFKGRDPSVSNEALRANWVDGAEVVYLGKANSLRRRLREFARFGEGEPIGHWGWPADLAARRLGRAPSCLEGDTGTGAARGGDDHRLQERLGQAAIRQRAASARFEG
jgi:hypothetical protein